MESEKHKMTWRDSIFYTMGLAAGLTIMFLVFMRMVKNWKEQGRLK